MNSTTEQNSLSKLISSVSNYRKESGSEFKLDLSSIKPSKLFHANSFHKIGLHKNYPIIHRNSYSSSLKLKNLSSLKNDVNTTLQSNNEENDEKTIDNDKKVKGIIDYFPVRKLIKTETKFINLLSKIKDANQLREEYIAWLNDFKSSPFYEFNFIFKNVFDNESSIKESVSNLIKNSSNLLIISSIICFWITDKNRINNNKFKNNNNKIENKDMKFVYELMINNHRIYLLLCLFILIESKLIDNDENIYVLKLLEQIKAYLAKTLRDYKNRLLIINEVKEVTKKLVYTINKIIKENNYYSEELLEYANNLNKIEISRLFEIFELIEKGNYLNKNKALKNRNDKKNSIFNNQSKNTYNNNENSNIYKKEGKINENNNSLKSKGLYIKKTLTDRLINNKKVENKIINIIINNNCSDNNCDNLNQFYINCNINKNNYKNNMIYQNNNNYNNNRNSITINVNNNNSYIDNYNYNNINKISKFKKIISNENLKKNKNIYFHNYSYNTLDKKEINSINNINNDNTIKLPQKVIQPFPPFLPPKQNKSELSQKIFTLILDLDETLVRYKINEKNTEEANAIFRPGLFYFLNKVYPLFEIVIWTVATKEYADPIIDIIEEKKKYFITRLFREHATIINNIYIKDLSNLGRDLSKIIIVDDKEKNFSLQKENGILIKPFYGTYLEVKSDFILYDLYNILTKIILDKSQDVRKGIETYQYEIKQKISQNYSKINNKYEENNNNYNKNNFVTSNSRNYTLKNKYTFIKKISYNRKIKQYYSTNDSIDNDK